MASNRSYRLRPKATADLDNIWLYSYQRWSADQADIYIGHLLSAFTDLAAGHRHGTSVDEMPGHYRLLVSSHIVYYQDFPTHVEVVRVLHQSMDPDLHL